MLQNVAPTGQVTAYDQQILPIYAELLQAESASVDWAEAARSILGLDVTQDVVTVHRCWESHLARARWIIGDGLAAALHAFGERSKPL